MNLYAVMVAVANVKPDQSVTRIIDINSREKERKYLARNCNVTDYGLRKTFRRIHGELTRYRVRGPVGERGSNECGSNIVEVVGEEVCPRRGRHHEQHRGKGARQRAKPKSACQPC